MSKESIRRTIREIGLRTRQDSIPLITTKGGSYTWLFDLRRVFMQTDAMQAITREFWEIYKARKPFQLGGLETAAIPLLTALMLTAPAERSPVNGFIIRKDRKTTGLGNAIEGEVLSLPIVLVDDILNSGSSADKARAIVSMAGHKVSEIFVVIDFHSRRGMRWRQTHDIKVQSLFTLRDFDLPPEPETPPPTQAYRELWRTVTPGGFAFHVVPKSAPLLVGERIYRGCDAAKMQAFSAATGGVIWEYQAMEATSSKKGIWSCPAFHDGKIYFGAYNGTFYCLDADTGDEVWTHPDGEWIGASPLIVPEHNLVYVGVEYARPWAQGSLTAYDLDTGEKVWEHQVGKLQHGSPGYWRGGDLIIWGSADHETVALNAKTGEIVWRFPTRRSVKYAPAVDEQRKLTAFAAFDKSIYVLDVATGSKRGEWMTGEICYTTPLFAGNKLFCGSGDRHLYVIDIDRMELIARIDLHARVYASPRLVGGRVIVATTGGRVVEIDLDTLQIKGILQLPDAITNAVALSDNGRHMYVSTYMNHLYAFERLDNDSGGSTVGDNRHHASIQAAVASEVQVQPPDKHSYLNFERIATGIDIQPMIREAIARPLCAAVSEQDQQAAQEDTETIFLRTALLSESEIRKLEDIHESHATPEAAHYPEMMRWVESFAQRERKRVARVWFSTLRPGARTESRNDLGEYYMERDRYHLILSGEPDCKMIDGSEEVILRSGDLWWIDNKQMHSMLNPSNEKLVTLSFDLEHRS